MEGGVNREYVLKLVSDIEEAMRVIEEDVAKPFDSLTRAEIHEIRYQLIVLVEALMALCYHIARRVLGVKPETPRRTLEELRRHNLLSWEEYEDFVALVRLRNLLVHRYWVIDDKRIYESVKRDFRSVRRFLERVKREFLRGG